MKRIAYIDLAKFVAISLVCIGHVNPNYHGHLHHVIYSFHMPLFMLMAGLFFRIIPSKDAKKVLVKKAKTLLLPAFTVSILSILIIGISGELTTKKIALELYGCAWFLKCLFLCYIVACLSLFLFKNIWVSIVLSEVFLLFVPHGHVFGLSFLMLFFWSGHVISRYDVLNIIAKSRKGFLLLACMTLLPFVFFALKGWVHHYIAIDRVLFLNSPSLLIKQYVVGLSGSLLVIAICYYISLWNSIAVKYLVKMGRYTLGIYIMQILLLERILTPLMEPFFSQIIWEIEFIISPLIGVIVVFVCYFLILIVCKNTFLNLLLFGGAYNRSACIINERQ